MAHIAGYLHAAAAAAAAPDGGPSSAGAPLFLCDGRAASAVDASMRVASLAAGLTRQLGMQVGAVPAELSGGRFAVPEGALLPSTASS